MHAADAEMLRSPWPMRLRREDFPDGMEEEYAYYDVPVPDVAVRAVPSAGFDVTAWTTPAAEPTMLLADGDRIDLGGRSFTVLHTPGHTAGSACLLDETNGTLFTGDAIYVDAALSWVDAEAMDASLVRLRDLDARIAHAGHERSFDGAELRQTAGTVCFDRGGVVDTAPGASRPIPGHPREAVGPRRSPVDASWAPFRVVAVGGWRGEPRLPRFRYRLPTDEPGVMSGGSSASVA